MQSRQILIWIRLARSKLEDAWNLFPELDEAIASSFEEHIAAQRAARATNVIHGAFGT